MPTEEQAEEARDMTSGRSVVFSGPVRTAIGTFGGSLKEVAAPDLGAAVIKAALERAGSSPMRPAPWPWATSSKPASR